MPKCDVPARASPTTPRTPFVAAHFGLVCRRVARRAHGGSAVVLANFAATKAMRPALAALAAPVQSKPSDHSEPRWVFTLRLP